MTNWFPGHMAKGLKELAKLASSADLMIEICDARIPETGRSEEIFDFWPEKKPKILIYSKSDLADKAALKRYVDDNTLALDLRKPSALKLIKNKAINLCKPILDKAAEQGRRVRPLKLMICGIPNCGKSTLVNLFCEKKSAPVRNKPGVTRAVSNLRSKDKRFVMIDSPGILPPKLDGPAHLSRLALTASISDDIGDNLETAAAYLFIMNHAYNGLLTERYAIDLEVSEIKTLQDAMAVLEKIAEAKQYYRKAAEPDLERAANVLINDFRAGRCGKICLDHQAVPGSSDKFWQGF